MSWMAAEASDSPRPSRVSRMPFTTPWGESGWYTGQVDPNGRPHGQGRMRYRTGKQYDGEWTGGYSAEYLENQSRMRSGFGSNMAEWKKNRRDAHGNSYRVPPGGEGGGPPVADREGAARAAASAAVPPAAVVAQVQAQQQPYVGGGGQQQYYGQPQGMPQGMSQGMSQVAVYAAPGHVSPPAGGAAAPVPVPPPEWYAGPTPTGPGAQTASGGGGPAYPQGYRPR